MQAVTVYSLVDGIERLDPISFLAHSPCADARRGKWSFFLGWFKSPEKDPGLLPYHAIIDGGD